MKSHNHGSLEEELAFYRSLNEDDRWHYYHMFAKDEGTIKSDWAFREQKEREDKHLLIVFIIIIVLYMAVTLIMQYFR